MNEQHSQKIFLLQHKKKTGTEYTKESIKDEWDIIKKKWLTYVQSLTGGEKDNGTKA